MARYEDFDDDWFDYGSLPEGQQQEFIFEQLGFDGIPRDQEAHNLFWDVMYNNELTSDQRLSAYDDLARLIWDEYGIIFAEVWDWEDFRAWYENQ